MSDPAKDTGRHLDEEQRRARQDQERAKGDQAQRDYTKHVDYRPHEKPVDPFLKDR